MTDTTHPQTAADEADVDAVASRAAQVITSMGADIRALTGERDRYRSAWRSARERAQAYGEGILRVVKDREQYQEWLRQAEERAAPSAAVSPPPATDRAALAEDLRYVLGYRGPGHAHDRPGVWDTSGKPCEHCARLAVARGNLAAYDADPDAVLSVLPPDGRAAKAEALLLHFTAEAHRRKWSYDQGLDDDGVPVKSEAFDALHRLGDEMNAELHKLRRLAAGERDEQQAQQDGAETVHACVEFDAWFDRTVCADPCGSMHQRCTACGAALDGCAWFAAETAAAAPVAGQPPADTGEEAQFGVDGCTCIPFTRQTNPPRYLNRPTDTVDMISGWETGGDCPHHKRSSKEA